MLWIVLALQLQATFPASPPRSGTQLERVLWTGDTPRLTMANARAGLIGPFPGTS